MLISDCERKLKKHNKRNIMTDIKEYLDKNYPEKERGSIKDLYLKNVTGDLVIDGWVSLESLSCEDSEISSVKITNCPNLKSISANSNQINDFSVEGSSEISELFLSNNKLKNLDFLKLLDEENLTHLFLDRNEIITQDLSVFSKMTSLNYLSFGFNPFTGSLEVIKDLMPNLKEIDFEGTNIDSGWEFLPASLDRVICDEEVGRALEQRENNKILGVIEYKKIESKILAVKT